MRKTKSKAGTRKKAAEENSEKSGAKPATLEEVRKKIRVIIGANAPALTKVMVAKAKDGQLPTAKFLFELLGFEHSADEEERPEEDSLARLLLRELGLPTEPSKEEQDQEPLGLQLGIGKSETAGEEKPEVNTDEVALAIS